MQCRGVLWCINMGMNQKTNVNQVQINSINHKNPSDTMNDVCWTAHSSSSTDTVRQRAWLMRASHSTSAFCDASVVPYSIDWKSCHHRYHTHCKIKMMNYVFFVYFNQSIRFCYGVVKKTDSSQFSLVRHVPNKNKWKN